MRFPPSLLDEIRARLPVSQVVSRKVALKRAGREFKGLSPFKQERTPSFTVNDQKGFYHCFASGEHGDIFAFVVKTEGLTFPEAVEQLAQEAGVPMPEAGPRDVQAEDARARLYALVAAAAAVLRGAVGGAVGAGGAALSRQARLEPGRHRTLQPGLRAQQQVGAEGASGQSRILDGRDDRVGHADRRRRYPGALRSLPPPHHVSHRRRQGPRDRLRRARPRSRCAGEIPELAGNAALPQGRGAVQRPQSARGRPRQEPDSSSWKATWT